MIEIEDFVEIDQIDPIFYDHPYYLAPGKGAAKAYALLLKAMEESGRVGIARVVIRSKEQLVALRPHDGVLHMETMLFGDEVVAARLDSRRSPTRRARGQPARGQDGARADRLAVERVRPVEVPRHLSRARCSS